MYPCTEVGGGADSGEGPAQNRRKAQRDQEDRRRKPGKGNLVNCLFQVALHLPSYISISDVVLTRSSAGSGRLTAQT